MKKKPFKRLPQKFYHLPAKQYWACWDLSNGHWQEHCYVWVYESWLSAMWKCLAAGFNKDHHDVSLPMRISLRGFKPKPGEMIYNLHYHSVKEIVDLEGKHPTYDSIKDHK